MQPNAIEVGDGLAFVYDVRCHERTLLPHNFFIVTDIKDTVGSVTYVVVERQGVTYTVIVNENGYFLSNNQLHRIPAFELALLRLQQ